MTGRWIAIVLILGALFEAATPVSAHEDHAPSSAVAAAAGPAGMAGMDHGMEMDGPPKPIPQRVVSWLGRWHPAAIHFPIALFLATGVLEAAALSRRRAWLADGTRVLIGLASVSAIGAASLGWLAMGLPGPGEDLTHTLHRWIGTGIAIAGLLAWWVKERTIQTNRPAWARPVYAVLLVSIIAAVLLNGFLGGVLSHGVDHLRF